MEAIKEKEIECVVGDEPKREGEYPILHKVGVNGVTALKYIEQYCGSYGIPQIEVYKGDECTSTVLVQSLSEIFYKQEGK